MQKRVKSVLAIGGLIVASGAVGGAAVAAAAPTSVSACTTRSGAVRTLGKAVKCRRGEKKLTWAIRGAAGARGPVGATGATGATGAAGPQGRGSSFQYLSQTITVPPNGVAFTPFRAECPAGSHVINGAIVTLDADVIFDFNFPDEVAGSSAWVFPLNNPAAVNETANVRLVCATPA